MLKRFSFLFLLFFLLLGLGRVVTFQRVRGWLEKSLVQVVYKPQKTVTAIDSLKVQGLKEEIARLKEQNKAFREQLGAIPERSNLAPADVVWETETELILYYPYAANKEILSHPVVFGETYLGRVKRLGSDLVVVEKPQSSGFVAEGETSAGVKGRILGQFNEQVAFETPVNAPLNKNDKVYLLNREHAWRFLVGQVSEVIKNARLPTKQGIINYLPQSAALSTVFVVQ